MQHVRIATYEIKDGTFAKNWIKENQTGRPQFTYSVGGVPEVASYVTWVAWAVWQPVSIEDMRARDWVLGLTMAAAIVSSLLVGFTRTKAALDLTVLFNGFKPLFQALSPEDVNKLSFEIIQVLQGEGSTIDSLLKHTASLTSTSPPRASRTGQ